MAVDNDVKALFYFCGVFMQNCNTVSQNSFLAYLHENI